MADRCPGRGAGRSLGCGSSKSSFASQSYWDRVSARDRVVLRNNEHYDYDIIIDASYEGSNRISKNISKKSKFVYQLVIIYEFILKNYKKMGLALMDGKFFSFLPKGKTNKHILYHVRHSVLKNNMVCLLVFSPLLHSFITRRFTIYFPFSTF